MFKKLNSKSGVSILFALLLFLVATVVSLVIIVAATSSVKREASYRIRFGGIVFI